MNDIESCVHPIQYIPQISLQTFEFKKECVICFELYTKQYMLPCNHTFCDTCIIQWFYKYHQNICPLCKKNVFKTQNEKQTFFLSNAYREDDIPTEVSYKVICVVVIAVSIAMVICSICLYTQE